MKCSNAVQHPRPAGTLRYNPHKSMHFFDYLLMPARAITMTQHNFFEIYKISILNNDF